MKIIISGSGDVGFYLAKLLEREYQDITIIDTEKEKLEYVQSNLGIQTILGDSTSYKVLKEAGIKQADLLISVTSDEATNIATCLIGKKLGAKFTIARINNMEYLIDKKTLDLKDIGIDDLISPESLAAREIKHILRSPVLTETFQVEGGNLEVMGLILDGQSPLIGQPVRNSLTESQHFCVVAIHRNSTTLIPDGVSTYQAGDQVYFMSKKNQKEQILQYTGKRQFEIRNVLVIGGSRTGKYIALKLSMDYNIKVIEKEIAKCNYLAKNIPNVHIVHGDGTDLKLLQDEKVYDFDAVVSVTGNSETNIFTCLIAKEFGVKKTIAMVENIGLFDYSQKMGIDTLINKKLAAANFIFRAISSGGVFSHLHGVDAEVQEFILTNKSKIIHKPLKKLHLPEGAIIGGVIRGSVGLMVYNDFMFEADDKVFIFSLPENHKKVNTFFK